MPIGIVRDVNTTAGTISIQIQGGPGTRMLPRVRLMKNAPVPQYGDRVVVIKDGRNYYCMGTPEMATPEAEEARASVESMPGDEIMGNIEGSYVQVRSGGMVSALADKVTGFIANKATGIVQLMGKLLSFDTTFFHALVRTESLNNTKMDVRIAGSPYGNPLSLEMLKLFMTTIDGTLEFDLSAFTNIKARLLINPVSGNVTGANINLEAQTPMGPMTLAFNGATGDITINAPNNRISIDNAMAILISSDGNPLDRVVRAGDTCWHTGGPIGQGSSKLYVGKGVL